MEDYNANVGKEEPDAVGRKRTGYMVIQIDEQSELVVQSELTVQAG